MALHHDLLEQADHLARRETRRPRQASVRRAISSAYYALFHLLAAEGARSFAPAQPLLLRLQVRRAFGHRDMQEVCRQFAAGSPNQATGRLLQGTLEPALRRFAEIFIELQEARHDADYDVTATFSRFDASQKVRLAREAFALWAQIRGGPNAAVFLGALLLQRHWRG